MPGPCNRPARRLHAPATSLWDNLAISARRYPAKSAVVFFGRHYPYAEVDALPKSGSGKVMWRSLQDAEAA